MLISPLARKLCIARNIPAASLRGSGPRGRIMACDVAEHVHQESTHNWGGLTVKASDYLPPTRPEKEGYYVYDCEVNMSALAAMSLPIAVQCERLLEKRYSLMDYILRSVVKACTTDAIPAEESVDVLLFEEEGSRLSALCDIRDKTIYQLASLPESHEIPPAFAPNIIICDSRTTREQVRSQLEVGDRLRYALAMRGGSPKVGIRVGSHVSSMMLSYTFYISSAVPQNQADHTAARLNALLHDPVSLLFIS